ncbi:MAG: hypothetical protein LCH89_06485 [Proteobacteria bacterium]|nr:hypothetical protein [Pseudomonadota bacterium]
MNPSWAEWPRPHTNLFACLELGWRWWLIALCGLALLAATLVKLQHEQGLAMRQARLEITLRALNDRLETGLALGFELGDNHRAQAMLEELLADDSTLISAEVFDASGISLFNTDRGAIGEPVPAGWSVASTRLKDGLAPSAQGGSQRAWSVMGRDDFTLGLPLRSAFGERVGDVCITSQYPATPTPWTLLGAIALSGLGLTALLVLLARNFSLALDARRDIATSMAATARLQSTDQRLSQALDELGRVQDTA